MPPEFAIDWPDFNILLPSVFIFRITGIAADSNSSALIIISSMKKAEDKNAKGAVKNDQCNFHESIIGKRRSLWAPHEQMAPRHETVHLHRTERHPHHRPAEDGKALRKGL